jgi:hypothetical protein
MDVGRQKVFISHAGEDKERFVLDFAGRLRANGVDAWVDAWEMLPGDSLVDKIFEEGIKSARAMIVVLSNNSVGKPWVREELNAGFLKRLAGKCRLIPVVIDDCEIPETLRSTVWQRIPNLASYENELRRVIDSIYGRTPAPPLGPPAAQVRRERLRDDLAAGRVPTLDTDEAQEDLESLLVDKYQAALIRLQALNHYLPLKASSAQVIEELLTDPDQEVRRTVIQAMHRNPRLDVLERLTTQKVQRMLADPEQEVVVASIRLTCDLVDAGLIPVELLTTVNRHSYWLVRRIAIGCIIKSGGQSALSLLCEFKTTSYHISQQLIRDFIADNYSGFRPEEKELAIDLLENLANAKRASDTSKSKSRALAERLLQQ